MWESFQTHFWAIAGNSRTIAVAYMLEVVAMADEIKVIPFSELFGAEKGGRIAAFTGAIMILMRIVSNGAVKFGWGPK